MHWLKFLSSGVPTLILIIVLNMKIGLIPPLGKFLDPFHGFWKNTETGENQKNHALVLSGLKAPVTILFDDRQVPHVFAENEHDLYFAQGYITAKDRLWQMEFQTHAAAGRLSEIVGARALEYDRFQRRVGMLFGARNALQAMESDSTMTEVVSAYSAGVNAYIKSLQPQDYPIEYKILDYAPEAWTPFKCALLLKYMAWMLTGRSSDLQMSNTRAKFGKDVVNDLFPFYPEKVDPVIPRNVPWDFKPLKLNVPQKEFVPKIVHDIVPFERNSANGSNNWAVDGSKSASGFPLLSNDPHLGLNLPSIWYEIQLAGPTVNVYGVSLPGAPNVIIGFNEKVAWGVTNAEADVMDWYEITFKDSTRNEYWYDNTWRPTRKNIEEVKVRGGRAVLDTVVYTHHGPVVWEEQEKKPFSREAPVLHALRWLGHDPSDEALTFYKLNHAKNYDDYVEALSYYACPAQNFIFAASDGDIAIWHNGKFPAKWPGQGRFISDGSNPLYDWQNWIPHEQNPHVKNPQRGFVSSANQNPVAPDYPYYLGWYYAPYYRGTRINQRLSAMQNATPDDFRKLQLDTKNLHAQSILPAMLKLLDKGELSAQETRLYEIVASWDFFDDAEKIAPTIFDEWWRQLYMAIWEDEFSGKASYLRIPAKDRTVQMILEEPEAAWFDNVSTPEVETSGGLVLAAFKTSCAKLIKTLGDMGESWQWGEYKGTEILHLAKIPGFGRTDLNVGGDLGIVNAIGRNHGPSWRMVVQLGDEVRAWGIYPGGQSGNPGSPHYDDFIDKWANGELAELLYLKSRDAESERITSKLYLDLE